jgi:hypothetical protein
MRQLFKGCLDLIPSIANMMTTNHLKTGEEATSETLG